MVRNLLKAQLYAQMMSVHANNKGGWKLSIAIPTYNYGKYLAATLEKLCLDTEFKYCEVVIGDSDSSDGTKQIVAEYMKQHPNIRYHNLGPKEGIDRAIVKTVDLCVGGIYIWLLSADDLPVDNCISNILNRSRRCQLCSL